MLSWLSLFGWKVELDRDGDAFVGVGHHIASDGTDLAICATAISRAEVAWTLFEQALKVRGSTEVEREILARRPVAA